MCRQGCSLLFCFFHRKDGFSKEASEGVEEKFYASDHVKKKALNSGEGELPQITLKGRRQIARCGIKDGFFV